MTEYPGSLWSPTGKTDKVDLVKAADINNLQNEVVATQTELGTDVAGSATDLKTRLARCIADNGAMRQGTSFPGSPNEGDFFYRTDEDTMYIYDGSGWDSVSTAGIEIFTSDGTFTAGAGVTQVSLLMIGGGGGGGGGQAGNYGGGGGGGGEMVTGCIYPVTPASDYDIVIGTAGTGGAAATNGVNGGDTSFDSTIVAKGGSKGLLGGPGSGLGGAGGTDSHSFDGSNGGSSAGGAAGVSQAIFLDGGDGGDASADSGGGGGSTMGGKGGLGGTPGGGGYNAETNSGGGGGGGSDNNGVGGAGAAGICIVFS